MDDAIGNLNGKIGMDTALPQAPVGMDENEWEARLDLAACYRMLHTMVGPALFIIILHFESLARINF